LWDTCLAEQALRLGQSLRRQKARAAPDGAEAARLQRAAQQEEAQALELDAVAARYGVPADRPHGKQAQQASVLSKPPDAPLTAQEIEYCALDAQLTALIREPQRVACDRQGLVEALDRVVMPWNVTAAEITWTGVRFDLDKCQAFRTASATVRQQLGKRLQEFGIENPASNEQLGRFLIANGIDHLFPRTETGRPSTRDRFLKDREELHPAIPLVRRWRKVGQLASDPAVNGLLTGADGRVHARLRVLGSDTGRTQSSCPNLMG